MITTKRSLAVVSIMLICVVLMVFPASANVVLDEDSTTYNTLLPFYYFRADSNTEGFQDVFSVPWSSFDLPNDGVSNSSFVERQYYMGTNTTGHSIGGNIAVSDSVFQMRMDYNGKAERLKFAGGNVFLDQADLAAVRSSKFSVTAAHVSSGRVVYTITYYTRRADAQAWHEHEVTYSVNFTSGQFTVPVIPSSSQLPLGQADEDANFTTKRYVLGDVKIEFIADSGNWQDVDIELLNMPIVESSKAPGLDTILKLLYGTLDVDPPGGSTDPSDISEMLGALVTPVNDFLAIEFMPGLSIGSLCLATLAIPFVIAFLKMFAGG